MLTIRESRFLANVATPGGVADGEAMRAARS